MGFGYGMGYGMGGCLVSSALAVQHWCSGVMAVKLADVAAGGL